MIKRTMKYLALTLSITAMSLQAYAGVNAYNTTDNVSATSGVTFDASRDNLGGSAKSAAVIQADTVIFPDVGDTRSNLSGTNFWNLGDYVEGQRALLSSANQLDMVLALENNSLTCDTQDHVVKIDGVSVGNFSINSGNTVVSSTFVFPLIAAGTHTIRIETTRTVASGCGSAGFPDGVSTFNFSNTGSAIIIFPATGDTRSVLSGTNFWNLGDYVEGARNIGLDATGLNMNLQLENNVLSCDTQDHVIKVDGVSIGNFAVNPGDTVVNASFAFASIAAGTHTIRIETTRTVTSGCGSAGFPNDVSVFEFTGFAATSLVVSPASSTMLLTQKTDLGLIIKTGGLSVTALNATLDGANVSTILNNCVIAGTVSTGGVSYRCPGVGMTSLGVGTHTLNFSATLSNGSVVSDSVVYDVIGNTEP